MTLPSGTGQTDKAHSVSVSLALDDDVPAYEDGEAEVARTEERGVYENITTATTTIVKAAPGFLYGITVNTPVASATITIYDSIAATGIKIATITLPGTLLSSGPVGVRYGIAFTQGLTIVTTGTPDITVSYR